jgi:signal transduction histidine kinase
MFTKIIYLIFEKEGFIIHFILNSRIFISPSLENKLKNLTILIIIATIAMLVLASAIIFFVILYQKRVIYHQQELKRINDQKQLELIQASIQGEEEERTRIASELHDDVGATLSSIRLFLHAAGKKDADVSILNTSKELLDESIQKIRNISHKLQPALLQQLGLQSSLESFAMMITNTGKIRVTYSTSVVLPRLHENTELSIYRITQELTNNIIRHANATTINIETLLQPNHLITTLVHNGKGLTEKMYQEHIYKKGSIGLKNIVNRLKAIDAIIQFYQKEDGNFSIVINAPLNQTNKIAS